MPVVSSVVAVHLSPTYAFTKTSQAQVSLLEGLGVDGDVHAGVTVKHRSRIAADPTQPNLRQVHLMHAELLEALGVAPGAIGENVTTRGIDLLALSAGTLLHLGDEAVVEVTGLRNPCGQLNGFRDGLLRDFVSQRPDGSVERRAGIMSVVRRSGVIRPGDPIVVKVPDVFVPMDPV